MRHSYIFFLIKNSCWTTWILKSHSFETWFCTGESDLLGLTLTPELWTMLSVSDKRNKLNKNLSKKRFGQIKNLKYNKPSLLWFWWLQGHFSCEPLMNKIHWVKEKPGNWILSIREKSLQKIRSSQPPSKNQRQEQQIIQISLT